MSVRRPLAGFSLIAFLLLPAVLLSGADGSFAKLDRLLQQAVTQAGPDGTISVIIRVRPGERPAVRALLEARGAQIETEHRLINALTARVSVGDLQHIAKLPAVESVSTNAVVTSLAKKSSDGIRGSSNPVSGMCPTLTFTIDGQAVRTDASTRYEDTTCSAVANGLRVEVEGRRQADGVILARKVEGLDAGSGVSSALRATLGLTNQSPTGSSVRVAIIDSGIEVNQDFDNRVLAFYDFVNGNGRFATPSDSYGHGTHIAGLIGSDGDLSSGEFKGVAPAARYIVLQVLGNDGSGKTSDVIDALEFAAINRSVLRVDVINLALRKLSMTLRVRRER